MYVFSNSMIEELGEYRVRLYNMEVFGCDANVRVEMKIFGEGTSLSYAAEYEITKSDGEIINGGCVNKSSKEELFIAIEEIVVRTLDKNL